MATGSRSFPSFVIPLPSLARSWLVLTSTSAAWNQAFEAKRKTKKDFVGQRHILYITGRTKRDAARSPYIEGLKRDGFEVLYMTDPVDEYAVQFLKEQNNSKSIQLIPFWYTFLWGVSGLRGAQLHEHGRRPTAGSQIRSRLKGGAGAPETARRAAAVGSAKTISIQEKETGFSYFGKRNVAFKAL